MKPTAKEHYQQLRVLTCTELWTREVPAFDQSSGKDRIQRVAVVRAVGVVFSESGTPQERETARSWLQGLLRDPEEKVRRYAMTALPKLGADASEERELLDLLDKTSSDREVRHLSRALEKIGGTSTLERSQSPKGMPPLRMIQKAQANVARKSHPGEFDWESSFRFIHGIRIHLHCRSGLEEILENEVIENGLFRVLQRFPGMVAVEPLGDFSLKDIFIHRAFSSAAFVLGLADGSAESLADVIASEKTHRFLETFYKGPLRYRLEFTGRGHQRGLIRDVTDRVFSLNPALINDSRAADWQIDIQPSGHRQGLELTPRLKPDPRFAYRLRDVPAASHPPLAACMARLAGPFQNEIIWDPFCGSGLELVESGLCGGVDRLIGSDISPEAVDIASANLASALGTSIPADFFCSDFRSMSEKLPPVSLIISNPPMGRRVPIRNLELLIADLFETARSVLKTGGRLVFANPLSVRPQGQGLKLVYRKKIDLGGFHVHLEKYSRV